MIAEIWWSDDSRDTGGQMIAEIWWSDDSRDMVGR